MAAQERFAGGVLTAVVQHEGSRIRDALVIGEAIPAARVARSFISYDEQLRLRTRKIVDGAPLQNFWLELTIHESKPVPRERRFRVRIPVAGSHGTCSDPRTARLRTSARIVERCCTS